MREACQVKLHMWKLHGRLTLVYKRRQTRVSVVDCAGRKFVTLSCTSQQASILNNRYSSPLQSPT